MHATFLPLAPASRRSGSLPWRRDGFHRLLLLPWLLPILLHPAPLQAAAAAPVVLSPHPTLPAGVDAGELLLGELNCVACHAAEPAVAARLNSRPSPRLGAAGLVLTPQFLRAWLSSPSAAKPGTPMPDLLHGLPEEERAATIEALVHYLASITPADAGDAVGADSFKMEQGRRLFHQVGCIACHDPLESAAALTEGAKADAGTPPSPASVAAGSIPLGPLASKLTVPELARFLEDPSRSRPSGRMPSLHLGAGEATALAMYLLRDQARAGDGTQRSPRVQGVSFLYYQGTFPNTLALDRAAVTASGVVDRFTLAPKQREERIGFRFTAFLRVPADGRYTFHTASDDGSRLMIDGQLVVDNDGEHATTERKGQIELKAGDHPMLVTYHNLGGPAELRVQWEGPGLNRQDIPPAFLTTDQGRAMTPLGPEGFKVDAAKAERGAGLFGSLGCAACHVTANPVAGKQPTTVASPAGALASLNAAADDGCLGNLPAKGVPHFPLSGAQRAALRATLARRSRLATPRPAAAESAHLLAALNCLACHSRDGFGGPAEGRSDYFRVVGDADLGDEGRLPPHLNKVGAKLRPDWLRQVLAGKGAVRPYMATRMPGFGPVTDRLSELLEQADGAGPADAAIEIADAKQGRALVGTKGLSCISCHTFAGKASLGIPALDLSLMGRRLKQDWFRRYLLDPSSLRPGTRMPSFWPEGRSSKPDILAGNTDRQVNAIWAYLSRGAEAGLPPGLVQGRMEITATNEAVIYRNFISGAGTRAIGVAYPEQVNLGFDANEQRLALIWQGPFLDAAIHRIGRGEGFAKPLGYNVVSLPAGVPLARLADRTAAWPAAAGPKAGYRMGGYTLDSQQRPTFLYSSADFSVEDQPLPVSGDLESSFRRTIRLTATRPASDLWFRAWVGSTVELQKAGQYLADGKIQLRFTLGGGARPVIRQSGGKTELLVPVTFEGNTAQIIEEIQW